MNLIRLHYWTLFLLISSLQGWCEEPDSADDSLQYAQRMMKNECYEEASCHFNQYLSSQEVENRQDILYQLAYCQHKAFLNEDALATIQSLFHAEKKSLPPYIYILKANIYSSLGLKPEALQTLEEALQKSSDSNDLLKIHAQLAIEMDHIKPALKDLSTLKTNTNSNHTAQMLQARIDIKLSQSSEAESSMKDLLNRLSPNESDYQEASYIYGEALEQLGKYREAIQAYAASLETNRTKQNPWTISAHQKIARCHTQLAICSQHPKQELEKAEQSLREAISNHPSQEHFLDLAAFYLENIDIMGPSVRAKARSLLQFNPIEHPLIKSQTIYLKSLCIENPDKRIAELQTFCRSKDIHESHQNQVLYSLVEAHFKQGHHSRGSEAKNHFQTCIDLIDQSFSTIDSSWRAKALLLKARAHKNLNHVKHLEKALETTRFLQTSKLQSTLDDPGDVHLINAEIYQALSNKKSDPSDLEQSIEEWKRCIRTYPTRFSSQKAAYELAMHYEQHKQWKLAESTYAALASSHPNSLLASAALYHAGVSARSAHQVEQAKAHFESCYKQYPDSSYASQAFFSVYPYEEYLTRNPSALSHLERMGKKFPSTPITMHAYYLLGLQRKAQGDLCQAKEKESYLRSSIHAFDQVEKIYRSLATEELKKTSSLIKMHASMEKGGNFLDLAKFSTGPKKHVYMEVASDLFDEVRSESKDLSTPSTLFEESTLALASVSIKQGQVEPALVLYHEVIGRSEENKVTRSYFLARAWSEIGKILLDRGEAEHANQAFTNAESAAAGRLLSGDQWLDLQIHKSHCFRAMGDPSAAMRILSHVVNEQIVSQKRLEAMYLRAEIYEQQGRPELAKRQLETLASKGGPWAKKAQSTLDEHYVY